MYGDKEQCQFSRCVVCMMYVCSCVGWGMGKELGVSLVYEKDIHISMVGYLHELTARRSSTVIFRWWGAYRRKWNRCFRSFQHKIITSSQNVLVSLHFIVLFCERKNEKKMEIRQNLICRLYTNIHVFWKRKEKRCCELFSNLWLLTAATSSWWFLWISVVRFFIL